MGWRLIPGAGPARCRGLLALQAGDRL